MLSLIQHRINKEEFFAEVMDACREAEKLPIERAFEMGIISREELIEISEILHAKYQA